MNRLRLWLGTLALLLVSLGIAEGLLQFLSARSRKLDQLLTPAWNLLPYQGDSVLAWRGNPRWPDHDAWGYRNVETMDSAEMVTLGDSHTYGTGVDRSETWPSVLGQGRRVYNMAFSGWGPMQGRLLIDSALALHPRAVLFGLYFGNDLYDAFSHTRGRRNGLDPYFPAAERDSAEALEVRDPIGRRAEKLFAMQDSMSATVRPAEGGGLRKWVSDHSKLYAVVRLLRGLASGDKPGPPLLSRDLEKTLARLSEEQRKTIEVYRGDQWRALLTPSYRNLVLDPRDIRVRVGTSATLAMLAAMDSACRARNAHLVVVLLPTKETVFGPRVPAGERFPALDSVLTNEATLRSEVMTYLSAHAIDVIDPLPALQASAAQPYFEDADGHPNAVGHRLIAEAVSRGLAGPAN